VPGERIEVIPNFVDTARYRPGLEPCHRSTLAPGGEKILMHVSNFRAVKRVEDVVSAFARVARALPARLVMVGDGPERPRAQQRAVELGVADQVLFLGKHAAVEELLSCADLFLLPSESESFGLAALEAMACGVPVVATNVGGLPEVVDPAAGALLPLGDAEGMGEAALEILSDPERHRRVSEAARSRGGGALLRGAGGAGLRGLVSADRGRRGGGARRMNIFEALVLGALQGAAEFLPVSSSGHLVMGQALLGLSLPGILFEVVVHVATLLSVLVVYRSRLVELGRGALVERAPDAWRYLGLPGAGHPPGGRGGGGLRGLARGALRCPRGGGVGAPS
jgi:hypothetical protein